MNYADFKKIVADVKEKNPVWFGLDADVIPSDAEIDRAEADLQVTFPPDYRAFIKDFGGGYFAFVNVFSVDPASEWNIVQQNKRHSVQEFIAVSDNGVGDLYGFRVSERECSSEIWFWDHEEPGKLKSTGYASLVAFLAEKGLKRDVHDTRGTERIEN